MARPLRIEYPDAWYHVMNRGRRRENIFEDREDFEGFISLLQETSLLFDLRVSAYCLMSNHYHLLVQTPSGNLSRAMRHVNGVYTQRYNRRWNVDGQLFRGRYKSVLVEEDGHLLELLRYIHRNPIRANMCDAVGDYPWSSHQGYLSLAKKWDWLHKSILLRMLGQDQQKGIKQYKNFVQCKDSGTILDFFSKKNLPSFLGSEEFIEWVKGAFRRLQNHKEIPQSRHLAPTISEIKEEVCRFYKVEESSLTKSRRGRENEARNVAIYLARKRGGLRLDVIGQVFGIEKYSSVSSVVTRMKKQIAQRKELDLRVEKIGLRLNKSQAKT